MSRYHLQKYAGISSRHTCPACERPRCFTLYIDDNGNILHPTVGRCDHESSCGYHRTPRQYFHDHPEHRHFVIPSERSESRNLHHDRHARPDHHGVTAFSLPFPVMADLIGHPRHPGTPSVLQYSPKTFLWIVINQTEIICRSTPADKQSSTLTSKES